MTIHTLVKFLLGTWHLPLLGVTLTLIISPPVTSLPRALQGILLHVVGSVLWLFET